MKVDNIIHRVTETLLGVSGIDAVVLGGSRAKGTATENSDIDIGICYSDAFLLDLDKLNSVASQLDDTHRKKIITKPGEWGPWINGGGWLIIDGIATDFLFRDFKKVENTVNDCISGKIVIDYQPGHPHGFTNTIYAAETSYCKILWEKGNVITELKAKLKPYPETMKRAITEKFLWEAEFSLDMFKKGVAKKDLVYAAGASYRVIACLTQVLYALNETYIMNEKGAASKIDSFILRPSDFNLRVIAIFSEIYQNPESTINKLESLISEVKSL